MQANFREGIIAYLQNRKGDYALYYKDLITGEELKYNENTIYPAASIIKIPIMIEFFRQVEAGLLDREELLSIPVSERVGGAGILHELRNNIEMTFSELLLLMIVLSDNTATNLIF